MKTLTALKHPDRRASDNLVAIGELRFSAGAVCDALWNNLSLTDRKRLHGAAVRAINKHLEIIKMIFDNEDGNDFFTHACSDGHKIPHDGIIPYTKMPKDPRVRDGSAISAKGWTDERRKKASVRFSKVMTDSWADEAVRSHRSNAAKLREARKREKK